MPMNTSYTALPVMRVGRPHQRVATYSPSDATSPAMTDTERIGPRLSTTADSEKTLQ